MAPNGGIYLKHLRLLVKRLSRVTLPGPFEWQLGYLTGIWRIGWKTRIRLTEEMQLPSSRMHWDCRGSQFCPTQTMFSLLFGGAQRRVTVRNHARTIINKYPMTSEGGAPTILSYRRITRIWATGHP